MNLHTSKPSLRWTVLGVMSSALVLTLCGNTALGQTARVSVDALGNQANQNSDWPVISGNNRFVAYYSQASNLVPGASGANVFLYDLQTRSLEQISLRSSGGNGGASEVVGPAISFDGRFVAFASAAPNLVPNDTNGNNVDVFLRDRVLNTLSLVSLDANGLQFPSGSAWDAVCRPAMSADGNLVAFGASCFPCPSASHQIYVRNLVSSTTTLASRAPNGAAAPDGVGYESAVSADGHYLGYTWPGVGSGGTGLFDLTQEIPLLPPAPFTQDAPSFSEDGTLVAFSSDSPHVPDDTNNQRDVFVWDQQSGAIERVSLNSEGIEGNGGSSSPTISADGRYVAFLSYSTNLVPGDGNGLADVFVQDRVRGMTIRASVGQNGSEADGASFVPRISADGSIVVFSSDAENLVPNDTNNRRDVFLRHISFPPLIAPYCFGDGSGAVCPCDPGQAGQAGAGCRSSVGTGGILEGDGLPSVAADSVTLWTSELPPTTIGLLFQGTLQQNGGLGFPFGDGLLCVNGTVVRMIAKQHSNGSAGFGARVPGDPLLSDLGGIPPGGGTYYYQVWYRDNAPGFCTPSRFNLTQAVAIPWEP